MSRITPHSITLFFCATLHKPVFGSSVIDNLEKLLKNNALKNLPGDQVFESFHPDLKISLTPTPFFSLLGKGKTEKVVFSLDDQRFCGVDVKAHTFPDGKTTFIGKIPNINSNFPIDIVKTIPDADESWQLLSQTTSWKDFDFNDPTFLEKSTCIHNNESQPRLVWEIIFSDDGLQYTALVDTVEIYHVGKRHFTASGESRIYPNNILDADTERFELKNLLDDGTLENDKFYVFVDSVRYNEATSSDFSFIFEPGTSEFSQTSLFTNANRMLDWLVDNGYQNFGTQKLALRAHQNEKTNNALYQPGTSKIPPSISVGDGDGFQLQNLSTDADVVAHELGHHVIYRSIKSIEGESLVLHEGLADFFTFAKTGNSCLGESICPESGTLCAVRSKCLRTASNDITYLGTNYPVLPHLRGQMISGMLWDLLTVAKIPNPELVAIVLKSIDLMVENSGFRDFVITLMLADRIIYEGKYCENIFDGANARGLGRKLGVINCSSDFAKILADDEPAPQTNSSRKKKGFCGTLSNKPHNSKTSFILYLLPILAILLDRKRFNSRLKI